MNFSASYYAVVMSVYLQDGGKVNVENWNRFR